MLVGDDDIVELADVLRTVLNKLYHGLNNPDYNYIIRSSPIGDEDTRHLHWYIVIIPIISIRAGFEIGSGIYINTVAPEEAGSPGCVLEGNKAAPTRPGGGFGIDKTG